MPAGEVLAILDALGNREVAVWIAGGWAVDALVGEETRRIAIWTSRSGPSSSTPRSTGSQASAIARPSTFGPSGSSSKRQAAVPSTFIR